MNGVGSLMRPEALEQQGVRARTCRRSRQCARGKSANIGEIAVRKAALGLAVSPLSRPRCQRGDAIPTVNQKGWTDPIGEDAHTGTSVMAWRWV